jgi:hypothetical protein
MTSTVDGVIDQDPFYSMFSSSWQVLLYLMVSF